MARKLKQTWVVEGMTFTREAIEKAYHELNTPEPLRNLARLSSRSYGAGVLLIGRVQQAYAKAELLSPVKYRLTVVDASGHGHTYAREETLLNQWDLAD